MAIKTAAAPAHCDGQDLVTAWFVGGYGICKYSQNTNTQNVMTIAIDWAGMPNIDATKKPINTPRNMPIESRSPFRRRANISAASTPHHQNMGITPTNPNSASTWRNQFCALSVGMK